MKIGYARVSTQDQNLDMQIDSLKKAGVEEVNIFKEKASGKNIQREEFKRCKASLRKGDTLVIWKLDRIGRSMLDLVKISEDLIKKGVTLDVLTGGNHDINTPLGKMIFNLMGVFAEYERSIIRERVLEGQASARARGKRGGRKYTLGIQDFLYMQKKMKDKNTNVTKLAKEIGISTFSIYKYVSPEGMLREAGIKAIEELRKNTAQ